MRITTFASVLLALAVTGCAMPDSGSRSSMSHSPGHTQADPANYHAANFGESNNMPFDGQYANW